MGETPAIRLKRLKMRSMRRGIREMDMILEAYADAHLAGMSAADLDLYEALLGENDHDLLAWISGRLPAPERFAGLIAGIAAALQEQAGSA